MQIVSSLHQLSQEFRKKKRKFDETLSLIYSFFKKRGGKLQCRGKTMNSYHVKFNSESFKIMTKHSEEIFRTLQSEIDRKLKEVQNSNSGISIHKALILTCFQLAEDKYMLKQAINKNINQLESQTKSLLEDIGISSTKISFE